MAKEVRWTRESIAVFENVIAYLEDNWTERKVENFIKATEKVIVFISLNPFMFRKTNKKNIHEALVTPHNLLIYKIYSNHIDILSFYDTRQHPKKKRL